MDPARAQAFLCQPEASPPHTDQMMFRNPAVCVPDLSVAVVPFTCLTHDRDIPYQIETRCICWYNDQTGTVVRRCFRVGDGHDDRKASAISRRREPFMTIDDPFISIFHGGGVHEQWVGSSPTGFRHGKAASDLSVDQRFQEASTLK